MDLKLVKQKLNALNEKGNSQKREKVDYSKIIWKPKVGKQVIRVVPSKFDKNNPFREMYLHYGFGKFPIYALTNWGEKDPIVEFAAELRKTSERENWVLAKKIEPKMRIFVPIIVRGEEEKGTRLWEIGKTVYQYFLSITEDDDFGGDFTDIVEGRDFTVVGADDVLPNGRKTVKCSVTAKPKLTPILEGKYSQEELDNLLENQPDILAVNRKFTFEALKEVLEKWLNPESEESEDEDEESAPVDDLAMLDEEPKSKSKSDYSLVNKTKKSKTDKFDELFNDDK